MLCTMCMFGVPKSRTVQFDGESFCGHTRGLLADKVAKDYDILTLVDGARA